MISIAVIIFNRVECVHKLIESLSLVEIDNLFIISDGPRDAKEWTFVRQCRNDMEQFAFGRTCNVRTCYSNSNMGCDTRIKTGLDWVFKHVDKCIILEDDCIPDKSFFRYCEELLDRYENNPRIACIAGHTNFTHVTDDSYFFSCCADTWGWATWRRAWMQYESGHDLLKQDCVFKVLCKNRTKRLAKKYIKGLKTSYADGVIPWDDAWELTINKNGLLYIVPNKKIVQNIGYDSLSTHTVEKPPYYCDVIEPMEFPMIHPQRVEGNIKYDIKKLKAASWKDPFRFFKWSYWRKRIRRGN